MHVNSYHLIVKEKTSRQLSASDGRHVMHLTTTLKPLVQLAAIPCRTAVSTGTGAISLSFSRSSSAGVPTAKL